MSGTLDSTTVLPPGLWRRLADLFPGSSVLGARTLAVDEDPTGVSGKLAGYGRPSRIDVILPGGSRRQLVFHVQRANDYGHDRRSDRAQASLLAWDTFGAIPRHARAVDVGAIRDDGHFVPLGRTGELYLLTDWCEGAPYARDLRRLAEAGVVRDSDFRRARALARYLVALHREPGSHEASYTRSIRDLVGSGEGVAGIVDGYPEEVPGAPRARLDAIEQACLAWRFRMRRRTHRLRRIHGDFHPFNVVFRDGEDFTVLDASRGSEGDPADDVTSLAINYLFFALDGSPSGVAGMAALWSLFWETYLTESGDDELLAHAAPFLAWRSLVLASPTWYPRLAPEHRDRLLALAERALAAERFDPAWGIAMLRA